MFKCTALLRCLLPLFCSPRSQLFNSGSTHTAQYSDHCNNNSTNNADLHTREICRFFVVHPIYIYIYMIRRCVSIYFYTVYIGTVCGQNIRRDFIGNNKIISRLLREILENFVVKCVIKKKCVWIIRKQFERNYDFVSFYIFFLVNYW